MQDVLAWAVRSEEAAQASVLASPQGVTVEATRRIILPAAESVGTNTRMARAFTLEGLMLEEVDEQAAGAVDFVRSGVVTLVPRRAEAAAAAAAVDQGDVAEAVSSEEE